MVSRDADGRQNRTDLTRGVVHSGEGEGRAGCERREGGQYGCQNEEHCSYDAMKEKCKPRDVVVGCGRGVVGLIQEKEECQ
jgi:hypothetical protein